MLNTFREVDAASGCSPKDKDSEENFCSPVCFVPRSIPGLGKESVAAAVFDARRKLESSFPRSSAPI